MLSTLSFFLVEGALYYERGTKLSEPNALNTPSLVTVVPNSGDSFFLVEGALYYERDTKLSEPNALNT